MGHAKTVLGNFALSGQTNREGYPAFKRDWKEQYLQMLLTNSMSDTFYTSGRELCKEALEIHRFAADEDPVFMAKALAFARNEGFMRLQPIVGLAVLSLCSPTQFSQAFPHVVRIVPDLVEFSLALESLERGQGGRAVKRAATQFLNTLDEYAAMKYGGKGRGFALRDLVRVYHPKPKDEKSADLFRYINKKLVWDDSAKARMPQLDAYEQLKRINHNDTAKAVELISAGRLPDNVVTGIVNSSGADVWQALLPDMPMFSLLRHLVTLVRRGVLSSEFNEFVAARLTDAGAIKRAKILPFRFVQAWRQLNALREPDMASGEEWWLLKVLEKAVEASVETMPDLPGRTAVMLDISGSMQGRFLDAGSVLALSLLKKTGGRGRFMLFDTE
ncbi:MAG: TROVE domain-containing protein, partial [Pyramidobacter sp.]|nr:TROVE domain-containing protein [Pyramidobacter sp.]